MNPQTSPRSILFSAALAIALLISPPARADELPDPDGNPADMPVKVFILLGQSNMLGFGKVAGADKPGTLEHATRVEGLYPFLVDDEGGWTVRNDVRNVRVQGSGTGGMRVHKNEWMTIGGGRGTRIATTPVTPAATSRISSG